MPGAFLLCRAEPRSDAKWTDQTPSSEGVSMSHVQVNGLTINYDVQGDGDPLLLIPYLSADHACFAFQLPAYTEQFKLYRDRPSRFGRKRQATRPLLDRALTPTRSPHSLEPSGSNLAYVAGVSLGAGVAMHLAARSPKPRRLTLVAQCLGHQRPLSEDGVVESWRTLAGPNAAHGRGRRCPGRSSRGASRPRCTWSGRSSSTRWWTSCVAARPSRWTRSSPRPTPSSPTTRAQH